MKVKITHPERVMFPAAGVTKGDLAAYYERVTEHMLPHVRDRPVSMQRFPDGIEKGGFFHKDVPTYFPDWIRRFEVAKRGGTLNHAVIRDADTLVYLANHGTITPHVWLSRIDRIDRPDRLVFDLDPGPGATVVECCRVAERLREILVADGLTPVAKTSGSKGMQLYAGIRATSAASPSAYAKALAERLADQTPELVVAKMAKNLRANKVFIDWSQNNPAKTTIAPYSLRGRAQPTVSTPVTWDEVRACRRPEQLVFTADDVLDRVEEVGDLFADLDGTGAVVPTR